MNEQAWLNWCQKQLSDLSRRMLIQGYGPKRIEYLAQASPEFRKHFETFMEDVRVIMNQMAANPQGFHFFDEFTQAKMAFLQYTNAHRGHLLDLQIAESA